MRVFVKERQNPRGERVALIENDRRPSAFREGKAAYFFQRHSGLKHEDSLAFHGGAPTIQGQTKIAPLRLLRNGNAELISTAIREVIGIGGGANASRPKLWFNSQLLLEFGGCRNQPSRHSDGQTSSWRKSFLGLG